jgi:hypothetical protein
MRTSGKFHPAHYSTIRNDDLAITTTWQKHQWAEAHLVFRIAERIKRQPEILRIIIKSPINWLREYQKK